jgi:SPW repeat
MAAPQFSLPKQWEDWCKWLLGFWLCVAPWVLQFDFEPTATYTSVITGLLIVFIERITLYFYRAWEEWINAVLGAWLVICPWVLSIGIAAARQNFVVVGFLVLALTFYELWDARRQARHS